MLLQSADKDDIACGIFSEKKYVKMIEDDIYNNIIEFKIKNQIIRMNRNYSNPDKTYRGLNSFTSIMLMSKIALDV